jgi:hypothetical protein
MARTSVRRKLDPQATARNPAECATTGAQPAPRVDRAKLTARVLWLTEVAQDLHVRQLNLEALLARAPGVRQVLRQMPRNLKAQAPTAVPFDARLWARGDAEERSRFATAVAWFRDHPGSSPEEAARVCGVRPNSFRNTPAMRELLRARPRVRLWSGATGGAARAVRYLAGHRPANVAEVARAVGVSSTALYDSPRFRKAWQDYARAAALHPNSRCRFGRPAARRQEKVPSRGAQP